MVIYVFDGTLNGLLSAVFTSYEQKHPNVRLFNAAKFEPDLLNQPHEVISDEQKANRVWNGLEQKLGKEGLRRIYTCYLSEDAEAMQHLFDFIRYIFDNPKGAERNFGEPSVIGLSKTEKSVNREHHRMKAFIRFQETADGTYYAVVEPDYNVLPLIGTFFKDRYADQKWIIFDRKRQYGLYYDLSAISEITFDFADLQPAPLAEDVVHEDEGLYATLWKDYFRSTNIPARKNMKLHIRHVPKRYWKHLTEKQ